MCFDLCNGAPSWWNDTAFCYLGFTITTFWDIIFIKFLRKKIHFQHPAHQHLTLYSLYCMIKICLYRCQMIHRSCTKQSKRTCDHFVMSRDQKWSLIFARKSSMTYFHDTWQVWTLGGPVYIEIVLVDPDLLRQTCQGPLFTIMIPVTLCHFSGSYSQMVTVKPRDRLWWLHT